ncbi:hypothetical protein EWM57_16565 [Hymenobacter persicinus]|nr:hypothetical protein EWM57_16565 [Hymenobacter persicinus]
MLTLSLGPLDFLGDLYVFLQDSKGTLWFCKPSTSWRWASVGQPGSGGLSVSMGTLNAGSDDAYVFGLDYTGTLWSCG